ncbi:DUF1883 domain-containing protein [Enterobacter asburiae]|uniref:DUF1883 domain-containing protein n=1 Tax=Enterobacter asburiae TaxID=61645 RepID=UPI003BE30B78
MFLNQGDTVVVDCSHQCNVMILTDSNFSNYKRGAGFEYHGGFYKKLPARISAPHSGEWNVVLDLGGGSANVRHSIGVIPA